MSELFGECPKCRCENIHAEEWESDCEYAWREVICSHCNFSWNEVYKFELNETCDSGVEIDSDGNPIDMKEHERLLEAYKKYFAENLPGE